MASPNILQIKRSQTTPNPSALANGEMAFTSQGNVIFIGNYGQVLAIGGQRTPGVLTANQALVANSTGFLDLIQTSNAVINSLSANGTYGSGGSVLAVDGSGKIYWSTTASSGPTYVQNTDSRTLSGNLTFSGANLLFSGQNVAFTGTNTQISSLNVTNINRNPTLTLGGDVSGSATFNNLANATLNVTITKDFVMDVYAGNGVVSFTGTGAGSAPTIAVKAADGVKANTTGLFANVDNTTLELYNGAIRIKNGTVNLGSQTTGDYVADIYAGNGISTLSGTGAGSSPTITVNAQTGLVANSSGLFIDPNATQSFKALSVSGATQLNGNVALGDAIQDQIQLNGSLLGDLIPTVNDTYNVGVAGAIYKTGYFENLKLGAASDSQITAYANTIAVYGLTVNSSFVANTATVYHDMYIGGDLHITGNAVYSNVQSYIVTDPLIQLASNNNQTDLFDIGFFGNYGTDGNPANHKHTGFFRDSSDGVYKIFTNLDVNPGDTNYVATGDTSYRTGTLQAYLQSGALVSNATSLGITGTSGLTVTIAANSLTLSTALGYQSGGTGYKTYTNGDLLVGNTTSGLYKLAAGAAGYILQSDGTNLYYGGLDGGTF